MFLSKLKIRQIFLLLLLVLVGCSTTAKEKKLEKDGLTLTYQSIATVEFDGNKLRLKHPVNISEAMVRNHLASIYFEEMTLLGKEKPVFASEDIEKVAPWLTKALNRVNPNSIVYFEVQTAKGVTAVEVFGDSSKLHWRFTTIRGVDFKKNMLAGWGNTWHLVPKEGQTYYLVDKLLGKKTWENWILADLDMPEKGAKSGHSADAKKSEKRTSDLEEDPVKKGANKKPPEKKTPDKKAPEKNPELEEKLRFLKQLQEKGLIDEGEYKRKRKTLVDEYL